MDDQLFHPSAEMVQLAKRLALYDAAASHLETESDQGLINLLKTARSINLSIGGKTAILLLNEQRIFVKKIRLTDLELQPENLHSTANLFELPLYYQYGISSAGFGAWRELYAARMATNWVLGAECLNFPLLYHWRVLPGDLPQPPTLEEQKEIERSVAYWGGGTAIRKRLEAKQQASVELVLFSEYIPETLDRWFANQFASGERAAEAAIKLVERELRKTTTFMNEHGLLHFDAHFENILTDGKQLYFTDFGQALCSQFTLTPAESAFFDLHRDYDSGLVILSFVHRILALTFGSKDRAAILEEYAAGKAAVTLPPAVAVVVQRYAALALLMKDFHQQLIHENKTHPFPAAELAAACTAAGLK